MSSFLDLDGVYDKTKRYIVNNWSDEDFTQEFGAETAYNDNKVIENAPAYSLTIKSGEMRELSQFEALTFTRHFVDREMFKSAHQLIGKEKESAEMGINNREQRKPYEDKTIQEIKSGETTPFMDKIREEIRQEELAKLTAKKSAEKFEEVKVEKTEESEESKGEFKE